MKTISSSLAKIGATKLVRKESSVIHSIVIFSDFLNMFRACKTHFKVHIF